MSIGIRRGRGRMSVGEGTMNMEYSIIEDHSLRYLIDDVNKAIREGWRPQGGICAYYDRDISKISEQPPWERFAQAMLKESN